MKIIIKGKPKEGKSSIAGLICDMLDSNSISVKLTGNVSPPIHMDLPGIHASIIRDLQQTKITITEELE